MTSSPFFIWKTPLEESRYQEYIHSDWYEKMISHPYQIRWMFNNQQFLYIDREPIISLVKSITELQSNQNIGMIVFSVTEKDIRKYLTGLIKTMFSST